MRRLSRDRKDNLSSSSYSDGFTLIELLVVIAIIGLLAAVVLASVGTARTKGVDAAVQSELDTIRSQAEIYANGPGNNKYTGVCNASGDGLAALLVAAGVPTNASVQATFGAAEGATEVYCYATGVAWKVQAPLSSATGGFWCVDSNAFTKQEAAAATLNSTACPP